LKAVARDRIGALIDIAIRPAHNVPDEQYNEDPRTLLKRVRFLRVGDDEIEPLRRFARAFRCAVP
jgi:hypothetical protein